MSLQSSKKLIKELDEITKEVITCVGQKSDLKRASCLEKLYLRYSKLIESIGDLIDSLASKYKQERVERELRPLKEFLEESEGMYDKLRKSLNLRDYIESRRRLLLFLVKTCEALRYLSNNILREPMSIRHWEYQYEKYSTLYYKSLGEWKEAIEHAEKMRSSALRDNDKAYARALIDEIKAQKALENGDLDEAIKFYERAIEGYERAEERDKRDELWCRGAYLLLKGLRSILEVKSVKELEDALAPWIEFRERVFSREEYRKIMGDGYSVRLLKGVKLTPDRVLLTALANIARHLVKGYEDLRALDLEVQSRLLLARMGYTLLPKLLQTSTEGGPEEFDVIGFRFTIDERGRNVLEYVLCEVKSKIAGKLQPLKVEEIVNKLRRAIYAILNNNAFHVHRMVFKILIIVDERALGEEQGKQEALNMCCRYIEELGRDLKKFGKQKDIRIDVEPLTRIKGWLLKNYILPAERIREIIRKI